MSVTFVDYADGITVIEEPASRPRLRLSPHSGMDSLPTACAPHG